MTKLSGVGTPNYMKPLKRNEIQKNSHDHSDHDHTHDIAEVKSCHRSHSASDSDEDD